MILKLNNILKIERADIELGGLTVLTGENNSGKSTIGKILFSILKTVNNVRQIDRIKTVSLVRRELFLIKKIFTGSEHFSLLLDDLQSLSINLVDKSLPIDIFASDLEKELNINEYLSTRRKVMFLNHINRIKQSLTKLDNPELAVKNEFEFIAKSEFMEPLNTYERSESKVIFHDETMDTNGSDVQIELFDGKISKVHLKGNTSIEDITYIESPLYLHILNTLRMSSPIPTASLRGISSSFRKENIPYHLADMAEKILSVSDDFLDLFYDSNSIENYASILKTINSTMGGKFEVDAKTKQLTFNQNHHLVPPLSVASGIKSFGVLQRLLQSGNISTSKMLIWDEPEIHLHPEWQIVFCKLIIELVAKGVPIVVTSHSPYFVQALRYYASAKGIEKDVKYYMSEESKNSMLVTIKEVTNDLNRVFTHLATPLRNIMNVDAVRNSMK